MGDRITGTLGDFDPLNKVPSKRARTRVQKGPLQGGSLMLPTYSLHCSSFLGVPFRILNIELVKPKKGPKP